MTTTDSLTGLQLGSYQIRTLLGRGGMASVYKGYDPDLDREVAVKVIRVADQPPEFVERFRREARVVAKLNHPNIVKVYQIGEHGDLIYMVQELLTGPTLEQIIHDSGSKGLKMSRVHKTMIQLAGALDYAHEQGVMHRDVKPSNALHNAQGTLILTDFGIARVADTTQTATGPGIIMGTPGYIAPEQAISSAALTPACDIYSLGVVLFELLTGQLPFEADTAMEVVLKHLYDPPPSPSQFRPGLPKAVDEVVLRAMSKEPEERYPSAGALVEAFQQVYPEGLEEAQKSAKPITGPLPEGGKSKETTASSVNSGGKKTQEDSNITPRVGMAATHEAAKMARQTPVAGNKVDAKDVATKRKKRRSSSILEWFIVLALLGGIAYSFLVFQAELEGYFCETGALNNPYIDTCGVLQGVPNDTIPTPANIKTYVDFGSPEQPTSPESNTN